MSPSHTDPSHPRYCSPNRFADIKRLGASAMQSLFATHEVYFSKELGVTQRRVNIGHSFRFRDHTVMTVRPDGSVRSHIDPLSVERIVLQGEVDPTPSH